MVSSLLPLRSKVDNVQIKLVHIFGIGYRSILIVTDVMFLRLEDRRILKKN